jgi:hypothetical protein
MHKLEQRLKRLEVKHGACNHRPPNGLPITFDNPADGEVEAMKKELAECLSCQRNGAPDIYVREFYVPRSGRAQDGGGKYLDDAQGTKKG